MQQVILSSDAMKLLYCFDLKIALSLIALRTKREVHGEVDDRCNLRPTPGYCKLSEPKYFFYKTRNECVSKFLGDCRGDKDSFDSEDECKQTCLQQI